MTRNVLVTGGAGYVGSHVCKALNERGFVPITFDNLSTGHRNFVKWGPLFEGDLLHPEQINEVFKLFDIDTVMHFAAKASVNESIQNPMFYYRENIQGSLNLLEAFLLNGGRNFIFSSSCATYGLSNGQPIDENHLQLPITPYGFSKLAIEKLLKDLETIHKFNYAILRYFNAAGSDKELEIGESHENETHVIPLLISSLIDKKPFRIFGHDYSTIDGTAIRDYVHTTDLAIAHVRALELISKNNTNLTCNLGGGIGTSVLELVHEMRKIRGDLLIEYWGRREGDPDSLVASNKLSRDVLGMTYSNSSIRNILETAYSWSCKTLMIDKNS